MLAGLFLIQGCQTEHYYSFQNAHPVNLFQKKNDVRLNAHLDAGDANMGAGFQAGMALTDLLSAGISATTYKNSREHFINGISTGNWNGNSAEISGGFFMASEGPAFSKSMQVVPLGMKVIITPMSGKSSFW